MWEPILVCLLQWFLDRFMFAVALTMNKVNASDRAAVTALIVVATGALR